MEERFRRNITITVDDPERAANILHDMIPGNEMRVNENTLTIYSHQYEASVLNRKLVLEGINVGGLNTHVNDIETFFLERIGE